MKKIFLYFLLFFSAFHCLTAADIKPILSPDSIIAGEMAQYGFVTDAIIPSTPDFPKVNGITWVPEFRSLRRLYTTGRTQTTVLYGMRIDKPGTYTIPRFRIDDKTTNTPTYAAAVTFQVSKENTPILNKDGSHAQTQDLFAIIPHFPTNRTHYYVGEHIPLTIDVLYRKDANIFAESFPELDADEAILSSQFSHPMTSESCFVNPYNVKYSEGVLAHYPARKMSYTGYCRAIKPGDYKLVFRTAGARGKTPISYTALMPNPQPINFYSVVDHVKFIRVPRLQYAAVNLNLVSQFPAAGKFSADTVMQGQLLSFDLTLQNVSDDFEPPMLNFDNFRALKPELKKINLRTDFYNKVQIHYSFIPLVADAQEINFKLAHFDPIKEDYVITPFSKHLFVTPDPRYVDSMFSAQTSTMNVQDLRPLKTLHSTSIAPSDLLKLSRTRSLAICGLFFIAFLIAFLTLKRHRYNMQNPFRLNDLRAKQNKKKILGLIADATSETFYALLLREFHDYYADVKHLKNNFSVHEITDEKLKGMMAEAEKSAYNPTAQCDDFKHKQDYVLNLVKRGFVVLLTLSCSVLWAQNDVQTANAAYEEGDYKTAQHVYAQLADSTVSSAEIHYNLGNVYYRMENYSQALLCYERARRYDVTDSAILSNLNLCRSKLHLPLCLELESPTDLFYIARDALSRQHWQIISTFAFCLFFVMLFSAYAKRSKTPLMAGASLFLIVFIFAEVSIASQNKTYYVQNQAIMTSSYATELYSEPNLKLAKILAWISPGESVIITGKKDQFYHVVTTRGEEGYVYQNLIGKIFNDFKPNEEL